MGHLTTIELFKEEMKFSAGHFTIFSATERENFHGHNFTVQASITGPSALNGMIIDYTIFKVQIIELCRKWDSIFILPANSPHLKIDETKTHYLVQFAQESLVFMKRDVLLLPVENTTIEEFARLILEDLLKDRQRLRQAQVCRVLVKVLSGPGQSASTEWVDE
jgi:6-pyruvoyltetrahydropterin/6-carboxytetrahydropterin synthase